MRRAASIVTLVAALHLGWHGSAHSAAPEKTDAGETARLIARLGSKTFRDRDAATEALGRIGVPALAALRQAVHAPDPEVRRRAAHLVEKLEKRVESDRLLAPKRLRLVYQDIPVSQAVSDLARQTGFPIVLHATDRARLSGRRITLDTGETTFWDAFDQFCRKAELVERRPDPPKNPAEQILMDGRGNQIVVMEYNSVRARPPERQIVLGDGKPDAAPTSRTGGVRIRALPPSTVHPGVHRTASETYVLLDVAPEPGIKWHGVVDVQIERAVDEHGQQLAQALASNSAGALDPDLGLILGSLEELDGGQGGMDPHRVPVRFRIGKESSRMLKEVQGTIAARVETTEPLITVDDIFKASDKTFRGTDGSTLRLADVRRDEEGQGSLRVQLETFQLGMGRARMVGRNRRVVFLNRGEPVSMSSGSWSLVDAEGQRLDLKAVSQRLTGGFNGFNQETTFSFKSKDSKAPLKLIHTGTRMVTVEVPFVLKDVKLP